MVGISLGLRPLVCAAAEGGEDGGESGPLIRFGCEHFLCHEEDGSKGVDVL